jgi:hypothetical protein
MQVTPTAARPVRTRGASRRALHFHCLNCVAAELDRIEAAHAAGTLTTTGNWTPGENIDHCAKLFEFALDGFPSRAPWFVRAVASMFLRKRATSGRTAPAGFKLPKDASYMLPAPGIALETSMVRMRRCLARIAAGERMTRPNPIFGPMMHEEWVRMQCGHCQLHLGFLHYPGAPGAQ